MDIVQQSSASTPPSKRDFSKLLSIIISAVALIIIISLSFFFLQKNKDLTSEIEGKTKEVENLMSKNNELEKELIFYKTGDLAKELEIVNLKLQKSDENLQAIKNTLSKTESELDNLQTEVGKVPGVTNILSLMSETASKQPPQCYSESDKQKIDSELKSFGDKTWQDLWRVFIDNTTSSNCSYTPDLLYKTLDYGYNKIVEATE